MTKVEALKRRRLSAHTGRFRERVCANSGRVYIAHTSAGALMRPDITFQVIFLKDGAYLAAPTVLGEFGREVRIEVPGEMRVFALAMKPDAKNESFTSAKMSIFKDEAWQADKEMSMQARLDMTPSFEYSVEGTPYRFVVMPRLIVSAASATEA